MNEERLTNKELQEAIELYDVHHVYLTDGGVQFVIIQRQRKGEKEIFVWQIIRVLRDRNAELAKRVKKLESEIQKHLIFLRKIHYDQMFNVWQYTPPAEDKEAADERPKEEPE